MKQEIIDKHEHGVHQWDSCDLADKHSPVEATMGDTHMLIAHGEYMRRFMNVAVRSNIDITSLGVPFPPSGSWELQDVASKWEKITYSEGTYVSRLKEASEKRCQIPPLAPGPIVRGRLKRLAQKNHDSQNDPHLSVTLQSSRNDYHTLRVKVNFNFKCKCSHIINSLLHSLTAPPPHIHLCSTPPTSSMVRLHEDQASKIG
ncbi:hypothetical protein E2C01_001856 [Portunus trituberculatus]|uniref:Uncharacterized protein n=1 Tax=Portunus trituberculatus TaxID=210409 RepID=A0A5B7CHS6_PORTR|nr:hypothetical protein [Portunus trituberculatus]